MIKIEETREELLEKIKVLKLSNANLHEEVSRLRSKINGSLLAKTEEELDFYKKKCDDYYYTLRSINGLSY